MNFFKSVYYDSYKNKLYVKECNNGVDLKQVITPKFEYYVADETGTSDIKDIFGIPLIKKVNDTREGQKSLSECGVKLWESDISIDIKYIQERYKNEELKVDITKFNIASLDIEVEYNGGYSKAEDATNVINLISVNLSKYKEVFTFGLQSYTGNSELVKNYKECKDEKELVETVIQLIRKTDVDIITGWNCDLYDITYIINRCKRLGIDENLISPVNLVRKRNNSEGYDVGGLNVLDYMKLYKNFTFENQESYSLNFICLQELGEGKMEYDGLINDLYVRDWNKYVEYNVQDVLLINKLEEKLKFIELIINIGFNALIPFERVFSTVAMHTGYIMKFLHKRNLIMPNKVDLPEEDFPGAHCYAKEGFYKYVVSFDIESLYPTLIRLLNISPETLRLNPEVIDDTLIKTPLSEEKIWKGEGSDYKIGGIYYDRTKKGVLPEIVEMIFNDRKYFSRKMDIKEGIESNKSIEEIKKILKLDESTFNELYQEVLKENLPSVYYKSQQHIRKIQINSLYGTLGNEHFHFYNIKNACAITLSGQDLIKYLSSNLNDYFKNYFYRNKKYFSQVNEDNKLKNDIAILIDTDSNFLCFDEIIQKLGLKFETNNQFLEWIEKFNEEFLEPFLVKLINAYTDKYNVKNILNFKREKIASKMIILAKKKYAVELLKDKNKVYDEPKIKITGIEVVRKSTPKFCREKIMSVIKELFDSFDKQKVVELMKVIKKEFKLVKVEEIATGMGVSDYDKHSKEIYEKIEIIKEINNCNSKALLNIKNESNMVKTAAINKLKNKKQLISNIDYPKGCPIHVKAAINYNVLINAYEIKNAPIANGSKIKFIYVKENNELHTNIIGFIGAYPEKFNEIFQIDYEEQWIRSFQNVMQRFFDVFKWGEINLNADKLSKFFK